MKRKISPALCIITLLCFLLPFASVSCGGPRWHVPAEKWATASGFELATRTVQQPTMLGKVEGYPSFKGEPAASVAALAGIFALALAIVAARHTFLITIASGAGALSLCVMKYRMDALAANLSEEPGMVRLEWEFGFWAVLFLFIVNVVWSAYLYFSAGNAATSENVSAASATPSPPS